MKIAKTIWIQAVAVADAGIAAYLSVHTVSTINTHASLDILAPNAGIFKNWPN